MTEKPCFKIVSNVRPKLNVLPKNPEENNPLKVVKQGRFPSWLHRKLPQGKDLWEIKKILKSKSLHTVCEEAKCPNLLECWSKKTATFLIMGKECTRSCGFCDIDFSKKPIELDKEEPKRVAQSVFELSLKHVVITQVARDDLKDGGAAHLAETILEIKKINNAVTIEVLTSDLQGNEEALDVILTAGPDIFNHNIETTRSMTTRVRHKATYERTLALLKKAKSRDNAPYIKSGIMVGLGELEEDVYQTIEDLKNAGCQIITIGQYLQANQKKLRVKSFVTPEQFKAYEEFGLKIGVEHMFSGPFVRSSYNAKEVLEIMERKKNNG
jgi:lipoyl synthase